MNESQRYLRELNTIGNKYAVGYAAIITKDYDKVAKIVAGGEISFKIDTKPYYKAIVRQWLMVGSGKAITEHNRLVKQKRLGDQLLYEWVSFLAQYAQMNLATRVTKIAATTERELQKIIEKGLLEGNGYDVIARMIRQESTGNINRNRSLLIARTEGLMASNKGAYLAAKSSGLLMTKEWLHAGHARKENRPHHLALSGKQINGLDEPFLVNGKLMLHPGDPAGGAEENCNCRCVALYRPKRTIEDFAISTVPQRPTLVQRAMQLVVVEEILRMIFINVFGED